MVKANTGTVSDLMMADLSIYLASCVVFSMGYIWTFLA